MKLKLYLLLFVSFICMIMTGCNAQPNNETNDTNIIDQSGFRDDDLDDVQEEENYNQSMPHNFSDEDFAKEVKDERLKPESKPNINDYIYSKNDYTLDGNYNYNFEQNIIVFEDGDIGYNPKYFSQGDKVVVWYTDLEGRVVRTIIGETDKERQIILENAHFNGEIGDNILLYQSYKNAVVIMRGKTEDIILEYVYGESLRVGEVEGTTVKTMDSEYGYLILTDKNYLYSYIESKGNELIMKDVKDVYEDKTEDFNNVKVKKTNGEVRDL